MIAVHNILSQLEAKRHELGMSCETLARRCGLGLSTVQRVLKGEVDARLKTLLTIAEALGVVIGVRSDEPAEKMQSQQAKAKARRLTAIAHGSSALEGQAARAGTVKRIEKDMERKLLVGPTIRLWS